MRFTPGGSRCAGAVAAICFLTLTSIEGQAPKPGPLLTDPARGDLPDAAGQRRPGQRRSIDWGANLPRQLHVNRTRPSGHRDFYVLDGEFHHEINGQTYVLRPGMIGVVKVGDKVRHKTGPGPVRLLIIWHPAKRVLASLKDGPSLLASYEPVPSSARREA